MKKEEDKGIKKSLFFPSGFYLGPSDLSLSRDKLGSLIASNLGHGGKTLGPGPCYESVDSTLLLNHEHSRSSDITRKVA